LTRRSAARNIDHGDNSWGAKFMSRPNDESDF
jgi:hypothetical protein